MTKLPEVGSKGLTSVLIALFSASIGALSTALVDVSREEPLALVVLALAAILLILLVAIANAFLSGRFVHIRELDQVKEVAQAQREEARATIAEWQVQKERWEQLALSTTDLAAGAMQLAKDKPA